MKNKNIIFDLDGTLVDSLPGIELSARYALANVLPKEVMPNLKNIIGPPVAIMFARLWPKISSKKMNKLLEKFRSHYLSEGCMVSTLFPGVIETISHLHAAGLRLFILTNKPAKSAQRIIEKFNLQSFFIEILSPDSVHPPFCIKTDGARILMNDFDLLPDETVLIGDSIDDFNAAKSCGFSFITATYGYGADEIKSQYRIKKFSEITTILL